MKFKIIFGVLIFGILMLSATIIADLTAEKVELQEGKNTLIIDFEFSPVYVSDLIKAYPNIDVISINESGDLQGYVNVFGGIGTDFVFQTNKTYEIITKQNMTIQLK